MIISLKSSNPKFSFVLSKNPKSIPLVCEVRQGVAFGWFNGEQEYNMYYKDTDIDKPSFSEENAYNTVSSYESNTCVTFLLATFLNHLYNKTSEDDVEGYENEIILASPRMHGRVLKNLEKSFVDYTFETTDTYLKISTHKTIKELLALVSVLCLMNVGKYEDHFLHKEEIKKYINCVNMLNSPYFVRYLFKIYFLRSKGTFASFVEQLNGSDSIGLEMGTNHEQRYNFAYHNTWFGRSVLDFGCGSGSFINLARKLPENLSYFCYDKDKDLYDDIIKRTKKKNITNVKLLDLPQDLGDEEVDVICSEVIEHNTKEDVKKIFADISKLNYRRIIITTPNCVFNKHYGLTEEELRNEDHLFEMDMDAFKKLIEESEFGSDVLDFQEIGDLVDGDRPQLVCIINKQTGA